MDILLQLMQIMTFSYNCAGIGLVSNLRLHMLEIKIFRSNPPEF